MKGKVKYFNKSSTSTGIVNFIKAKLKSFDRMLRLGKVYQAFDNLKAAQVAIEELKEHYGQDAVDKFFYK